MNPQNLAVRAYGSVASTTQVSWTGLILNATATNFIDYPEITNWTVLLDGLTNAFNGTVNFQFASQDVALSATVSPTSIQINGGTSGTFNQPAAFTGTQVVLFTWNFPVGPWRLTCTAFTSGTLRAYLVGV